MKYWLTTHWAPSIRHDKVEPHEGVWVQNKLKEAIEPVQPGDRVFVYETGGGKREAEVSMYGKMIPVKRIPGRQGVVALLEVTESASEILYENRTRYISDDNLWWRYHAPTKSINSKGFVNRKRVCEIIGWSSTYSLRGIGQEKSGLKQLTQEQYHALHWDFMQSLPCRQDILEALKKVPTVGHDNGGEGPEHRALKHQIASNPSFFLQEEGLQFVKMEAPFATNDRVDLVLRDRDGRYIVVEVEVDCGPAEMAGPLQCLKYQVMWAYIEERPVEEIRTMLVARSMHPSIIQRARNAGIECVIVPK